MIVNKPGHIFLVDNYAARESAGMFDNGERQMIKFLHRVGDGYPGNIGAPFDGTNCQEIFRMLVARLKYLNGQIPCEETKETIKLQRMSLHNLEVRAALRRGDDYYRAWKERLTQWYLTNIDLHIESIPACRTCGHILCTKHEVNK